jgi:hypothetical protein
MAKDKAKKAVKAAAAPVKAAEAPKASFTACACSRFSVLVNLRNENEDDSGDLIWDEELTTGCGGGKTKATFLPGHDAKLKSALIKWGIEGYDVQEDTGGVTLLGDALKHAAKFGFDYMVSAGIKRGTARLAEKRDKAEARAAKKAAPKPTKPKKTTAAAVKPEPAPPLAEVVASEQAAHEEAEKAKVAEREKTMAAEWSEETPATPEGGCELTDKPEVQAKVGRWEYTGVVCEAGHLHYLAKDGHTRKQAEPGKFEVRAEV